MILEVELAGGWAVHLNGFENLREAVSQTCPACPSSLENHSCATATRNQRSDPDTTQRQTRCDMLARRTGGCSGSLSRGTGQIARLHQMRCPRYWAELSWEERSRRTHLDCLGHDLEFPAQAHVREIVPPRQTATRLTIEDWRGAYLWTAMVTAKDDDVVCCHDG